MKYKCSPFFPFFSLLLWLHLCFVQNSAAFSISEEREVGEKLLYSVRSTFSLLDDPDLTSYVTDIGNEILAVAGQQYFDYHFFVINNDDFNAFAAPSGLVFFYAGLIGAMQSEEEFISVLAHEIGHVVKRHIAKRVEQGKLIGVASLAAAVAALALGEGKAASALLTSSLAAGQSAALHYSRKNEEEADLLAYGWMQELGCDVRGQERMLKTMRRIARYRSEALPQYLLTHPNPEARLEYVRALLSAEQEKSKKNVVRDQFDFLRFKYRVMSQAMESNTLREQLVARVNAAAAGSLEKAMAQYGLGQLALQEGNYTKALALLEQVAALYPDRAILRTDIGVALAKSGRFADAIAILQKSTHETHRDLYGLFFLAKSYQAIGQAARAEQIYTTISYALPKYSKVYFELGQLAANRGDTALASLYLGKYFLYEGKIKRARFSLNKVIEDGTASPRLKKEAEKIEEKLKDLEKK